VSLSAQDLDRGEQQNREALRTFVRCYKQWSKTRDLRAWPGPGGFRRDAEEIFMPDWYRDQVKARLAAYGEEE
jgi:hypothetical protein